MSPEHKDGVICAGERPVRSNCFTLGSGVKAKFLYIFHTEKEICVYPFQGNCRVNGSSQQSAYITDSCSQHKIPWETGHWWDTGFYDGLIAWHQIIKPLCCALTFFFFLRAIEPWTLTVYLCSSEEAFGEEALLSVLANPTQCSKLY